MNIAALVEKDLWFQYVKISKKGRLRLFCLPYAGGGASIYQQWEALLPPEIELYPIQLPGREKRWQEAPYRTVTEVVQPLVQVLLPYLDKPFALFGHSMGALISFELARQLRRRALPMPCHLLISAHRAPQLPYSQETLHDLPYEAFLARLETLGTIPQELLSNEEAMSFYAPIIQADFSICECYSYRAEAPLPCPISVFGGLLDERVNHQELAAWDVQSSDTFALNMVAGDHFFLQSHQDQLVQSISQILLSLVQ